MTSKSKKKVNDLIAENKIKEAILLLSKSSSILKPKLSKEVSVISSQFHEYQRNIRLNLTDDKTSINRIRLSLLELNDRIHADKEDGESIDNETFSKNRFVKLISIILLLGLVIGFIFFLRNSSSKSDQQIKAGSVYDTINPLIEKRLYRMRKILWAYKSEQGDIEENWREYREVLEEWNVHLHKNTELFRTTIGQSISRFFVFNIHYRFREIGQNLEDIKSLKDSNKSIGNKLISIENDLDKLDLEIERFNRIIFNFIETGDLLELEDFEGRTRNYR